MAVVLELAIAYAACDDALLGRKVVGYNIRNGDFLVVLDHFRSRGIAFDSCPH